LWKKKVFKCEREVNIEILGGSHRENVKIKENIAKQVNHPVRWQTILEQMAADGIDIFVEGGAGKNK